MLLLPQLEYIDPFFGSNQPIFIRNLCWFYFGKVTLKQAIYFSYFKYIIRLVKIKLCTDRIIFKK